MKSNYLFVADRGVVNVFDGGDVVASLYASEIVRCLKLCARSFADGCGLAVPDTDIVITDKEEIVELHRLCVNALSEELEYTHNKVNTIRSLCDR